MHILMQILPAMEQSRAIEKIQDLVEKFRREQAAGVIGQYASGKPAMRNYDEKDLGL